MPLFPSSQKFSTKNSRISWDPQLTRQIGSMTSTGLLSETSFPLSWGTTTSLKFTRHKTMTTSFQRSRRCQRGKLRSMHHRFMKKWEFSTLKGLKLYNSLNSRSNLFKRLKGWKLIYKRNLLRNNHKSRQVHSRPSIIFSLRIMRKNNACLIYYWNFSSSICQMQRFFRIFLLTKRNTILKFCTAWLLNWAVPQGKKQNQCMSRAKKWYKSSKCKLCLCRRSKSSMKSCRCRFWRGKATRWTGCRDGEAVTMMEGSTQAWWQ